MITVLMVMAVVLGIASAQGPSAAPAYAPAKSTVAAAPTKASSATIAATPERSTSVSASPESPTLLDIASPPAPGSEAAEGPTGDFSSPVPIADTPAESPHSGGAALKASAIVGVAAVVGSLLF